LLAFKCIFKSKGMLDIAEKVLPFGADMWETVALLYNGINHLGISLPRKFTPREAESLRMKFKTLVRIKKPTGDPNCPEEVRRAKRIHYKIEENMDVAKFDDSSNDERDDEVDDEVVEETIDEESNDDKKSEG
jgi:hypothetical protein